MNTISVFFLLLSFASSTQTINESHINLLLNLAEETTQCENNENTVLIARKMLQYASLYVKNDISPTLAFKIPCAESHYINQPNYLYHKNPNYWSAYGVYMYTRTTWEENCKGDRFNAEDNIDCGVRMIGEGKLYHWNESKHSAIGWAKPHESP